MARIKQVLNERRVAYEGALKIHADNRRKAIIAKQARAYGVMKLQLQKRLKVVIADDKLAERKRISKERRRTRRLELRTRMERRDAGRLRKASRIEEATRLKLMKDARVRRHLAKHRLRRRGRNGKGAREVGLAAGKAQEQSESPRDGE